MKYNLPFNKQAEESHKNYVTDSNSKTDLIQIM